MKKQCILMVLFGLVLTASSRSVAQTAQEDTVIYGWSKEVVGTLNLTQASFDNWQAGGENTLAWQVNLNTNFTLERERFDWTNTGKFVLGYAKIEGEEARKSADQINLESVYTRKFSKFLNPFVAVTAKTQFLSGFQYFENDSSEKISEFLDPGYFTQSAGFGYQPNKMFKTRLGATFKETVTDIFPQESGLEVGISSVSNFKRKFQDNVIFASKLDVFSDLEAFDRIDVLWENELTLKVAKYITVTVEGDLFYDKDISDKKQIRQTLAVGLTYTFLE